MTRRAFVLRVELACGSSKKTGQRALNARLNSMHLCVRVCAHATSVSESVALRSFNLHKTTTSRFASAGQMLRVCLLMNFGARALRLGATELSHLFCGRAGWRASERARV